MFSYHIYGTTARCLKIVVGHHVISAACGILKWGSIKLLPHSYAITVQNFKYLTSLAATSNSKVSSLGIRCHTSMRLVIGTAEVSNIYAHAQ